MNILNKESGVYGLSNGFSSDFRDLEDAYLEGNEDAARALKAFSQRVIKYIGAYVAEMDGADAICFTAGLGENSPCLLYTSPPRLPLATAWRISSVKSAWNMQGLPGPRRRLPCLTIR